MSARAGIALALALVALAAPAASRGLAATAPARAAGVPAAPYAAFARSDPQVAAAISGQGTPDTGAPLTQTGVEIPVAGRAAGDRRTVDQVNEAAPTFTMPTAEGAVEAKPSLSVSNSGGLPGMAGGAAGPAGGASAAPPTAAAVTRVAADLPGDPNVPVAPSYMPPTNPAYKAGAPAPALAELVAAARAAEAPAKALAAARAAAVGPAKPVVPTWEGEEKQAAVDGAPAGGAAKPAAAKPASTTSTTSAAAAAADNGGVLPKHNPALNAADGGRIEDGTASAGVVRASGLDNPTGQVVGGSIGGTTLNALVGVRVATPFFGTGFNLCVDRYFGSFPKVGIVIPNPIAWLLPELMELGDGLRATIDLPIGGKSAPAGAKVSANSDGFVIWLPSIQPTMLGEFGFRYGLQVAQLFGVDFGFGLLKSTCTIDFVRV